MNLTTIVEFGLRADVEQERECRRVLADLRRQRVRAEEDLLDMCCRVQRNSSCLDPERISCRVAEIKYLDRRTAEIERFLALARKLAGKDQDS